MKNERKCRKCGNYIPYRITIDGKARNLQGRKFCLNCSPFGTHNTKTDDPDREAKRKSSYKEWSPEQKRVHTARVYRRAIQRKEKLIDLAGGGCKACGYNKCHRALSFHHRNPENKEFALALNNLWSKSWENIETEFEKCDLLCVRCHMELEDELAAINKDTYRSIIAAWESS